MGGNFETHYHGTTVDRLVGIVSEGTLPMYRPDTGLTGAWTTRLIEKSLKHARERGEERGGIEPVVLEYNLPVWWIRENNDRKAVDSMGYDNNVHCFKALIPQEYFVQRIYPNRHVPINRV